MKLLLSIALIAIFSWIAGVFLPWWSIALVAFLVGLLFIYSLWRSFLAGFIAIFILWGLLALWIDIKNESILSHKIAQIFPLGGSSFLMILVTAFIGGLVGGFAAMAGSALKPALRKA